MDRSTLEARFLAAWEQYGLTDPTFMPTEQYGFALNPHTGRRFKVDFAWPAWRVAVECDGYGFGHSTIAAKTRDALKRRVAIEQGWIVIPFTSTDLSTDASREQAVDFVIDVLAKQGRSQ